MEIEWGAEALAKAIEIPTEEWPGCCHKIAALALNVGFVKGELCYGMYTGHIAEDSYFADYSHLGFCRHGWIEKEDGTIFDPTRWVLESVDPYIYEAKNHRDYDYGMARFKEEVQRANPTPCPRFTENQKQYEFPDDESLTRFIKTVCGMPDSQKKVSRDQIFWIANRVPQHLGANAAAVYQWIADQGQKVYIPIDFQRRYLKKEKENDRN